MSEPFVGQIIAVGFNFAPVGWAVCAGQSLDISAYSALYALIGTTYGGNGQTTFNLPDLRGRVAISQGQGPGLSNYVIGQVAGSEQVTLNANQMAGHTHALMGTSADATSPNPASTVVLGSTVETVNVYTTPSAGNVIGLDPRSIGTSGGSQPHENRQPYQTINYLIALEGIFPSQT